MSASALFVPSGGEGYTPAIARIATLPKSKRQAALLCWQAIVDFLRKDKPELRITDWMLRSSPWLRGFSLRFVQKGLMALSERTERNPDGLGLIDRIRRRGLRTIVIVARLAGRDRDQNKSTRKTTKARAVANRAGQVPNVGNVPPTTQAHVDHAAAIARKAELLPEPTPEQIQETQELLECLRREREERDRREQARRERRPRPPDP